jgi:GntR family transcriptional regulator, transcriptional repressor for pyruvate dehydrogenase complex
MNQVGGTLEPDDAAVRDRPLRRRSVVDQLVERMTRRIVSGEWPTGSVIPPLRTLAEETAVSPLTVREAIRVLQARGLLETRHGVGTFVSSKKDADGFVPWMLGAIDVEDYGDLVEARDLIEGLIVSLAARRRTEEELENLRRLLEAMAAHPQDPEKFLDADTEFHIALAESSHNPILVRSVLAIRGPLRRLMDKRNRQLLAERGSLASSIEMHTKIVDAIERKEPEIGEELMREISRQTMDNLDSRGGAQAERST